MTSEQMSLSDLFSEPKKRLGQDERVVSLNHNPLKKGKGETGN